MYCVTFYLLFKIVKVSGNNRYGQLGLGDKQFRTFFTPVSFFENNPVHSIATGYLHTGAISSMNQ